MNIPDSVSSKDLLRLIKDTDQPLSDRIPTINFGTHFGGPCDLQLVMSTVIAKSVNGVNAIQILMTALHLLIEAEHSIRKQRDSLDSVNDADINPEVVDAAAVLRRITDRNVETMRSCIIMLERVLDSYAPISRAARISDLERSGIAIPIGQPLTIEHQSQLLFSDELLDSLDIQRSDLNEHLSDYNF